MRTLFFAVAMVIAASAGLAAPAAAAWGPPGFDLQAQSNRGRGQGQERAQSGRDVRPERRPEREDRRERLNDDERRALHRDLDKANRELYQRRNQR